VLDDDADLLERRKRLCQLRFCPLDLGTHGDQLLTVQLVAVPLGDRGQLEQPGARGELVGARGYQPLGVAAYLLQGGTCLGRGEETLGHRAMIPATWRPVNARHAGRSRPSPGAGLPSGCSRRARSSSSSRITTRCATAGTGRGSTTSVPWSTCGRAGTATGTC